MLDQDAWNYWRSARTYFCLQHMIMVHRWASSLGTHGLHREPRLIDHLHRQHPHNPTPWPWPTLPATQWVWHGPLQLWHHARFDDTTAFAPSTMTWLWVLGYVISNTTISANDKPRMQHKDALHGKRESDVTCTIWTIALSKTSGSAKGQQGRQGTPSTFATIIYHHYQATLSSLSRFGKSELVKGVSFSLIGKKNPNPIRIS